MQVIGFRDGFRGLVQDQTLRIETSLLSDILTDGGTILGTSRDKPHKMLIGGKFQDMTGAAVDTYKSHQLDAVGLPGRRGTQKNALRIKEAGLNVITLPKTIDNDVAGTDMTFGFDTAMGIATEAIDRLHSTATSHHRVIVVEIMGHRAGWLALGSGIAGGADAILIPRDPLLGGKRCGCHRRSGTQRKTIQHCRRGRRCHDDQASHNRSVVSRTQGSGRDKIGQKEGLHGVGGVPRTTRQ